MLMIIPMTPSGIEPSTFRFVAQYLNHWATISGPQIIINYCTININKYIINSCNYYISDEGLLEECDKEENLAVTGAVTASCLKVRM
jgi:hypothetical protein